MMGVVVVRVRVGGREGGRRGQVGVRAGERV